MQHVSAHVLKPEDDQLKSKKSVLKVTHFYRYNYYIYIQLNVVAY